MSTLTQHGARFIVLGLSVTQFGAQAVVAMADEAIPGLAGLAGLVASDTPATPRSVAVALTDAGAEPEGCDPSGCAASYSIERLSSQGYELLPGAQSVNYLRVRSNGPAIVEDAVLRVDSGLGATIAEAPGCTVITASSVECALGDIAPFQSSGATIVLEPTQNQFWVESVVVSPTTNSSNSFISWPGSVNTFATLQRFTGVDDAACPLIEGHVVQTNTYGESIPFDLNFQARVAEDQRFTPSVAELGFDTPLTIAIVLDNATDLAPGDWTIVRQRMADFVLDWQTWATTQGIAPPAFGIYTTGPAMRELEFSTDASEINAQLQAIERGTRASGLYAALDLVGVDLSSRQGRRIALLITSGGDADGASGRDLTIRQLNNQQVSTYAVAIGETKGLLSELSDATSGFAQVPGSVQGLEGALDRIAGDLRGSVRHSWLTPFQDSSYRDVEIAPGFSLLTRGYQPSAACATPCAVVRDMPDRYSNDTQSLVTLTLDSNLINAPVTLTERLPQAWQANSISDGGQYDPSTNSVVWSFADGPLPPSVSYSVIHGFSGARERIIGQFKDSTGAKRFCGDSQSLPLEIHPLDRFGQGSIGTSSNADFIRSYSLAWRYGSQWINGPRQIEVAYVTRTVQIARLGGSYVRVDESPPWRSAVEPPVAGPRASQRSISALTQPGQPVTVQLAVDPGSNSQAYAVEEVIPPGWQMQNIGADGQYDSASRTIRWGPFEGDGARILSYTISSPDADSAVLVGRFSVDGVNTPIDGTNSIGDDALFADGFD